MGSSPSSNGAKAGFRLDASRPRPAPAFTLLAAAFLFAAMAVVAGLVSRRIPGPQVALVRFAVGVVAVSLAVIAGRARLRLRRWDWLLVRGIFGGVAVFAYFSCIEHVGVGVATLLNYTAPVWSMLLGWWLLDEPPRRSVVGALVLTLTGVMFVVSDSLGPVRADWWELAGVFSAICSGVAITAIRAVRRPRSDGAEAEGSWTVFASFTGFGVLVTLPGVLGPLGHWVSPSPSDWVLLITVGIFSVGAQLLMTSVLEHVTGPTMGVIQQLTVVLTLACGVLFLGERLTLWSLLGCALTVSGVAWIMLVTTRPAPAST